MEERPNVRRNLPAEAEGRSEPASAACRRSGCRRGWGSGRKQSWVFHFVSIGKAWETVVVPQKQPDGNNRHHSKDAEEGERNARPEGSALGGPRTSGVKPSIEVDGQQTVAGSKRRKKCHYPKEPQLRARRQQRCSCWDMRLAPCLPTGVGLGNNRPLACADETGSQNAQDGAVREIPREKREREASDRKPEMSGDTVFAVTTEGVAESRDSDQGERPGSVPLGNLLRGAMHSRPPTLRFSSGPRSGPSAATGCWTKPLCGGSGGDALASQCDLPLNRGTLP